ncbi:CD209 antigen-like [Channa argus]|uniref:CD209 antigen-like n=1 Tax=Channa argus TaxID=215402 RepID=UPI003521C8CA
MIIWSYCHIIDCVHWSCLCSGPRSSERRFYGAAVLCLGLLSVFLLVGLISLGVHYHNSERGAAAELSTVKANMTELLQDSEKEVSSLTGEKNQLKTSLSSLTAERNQLKTSLSSLTAERDQLKTGLSSLTAERDQLKTSLSSLTREKNQLDARLIEMTKDRDRLESLSRKSCPAGWTMFSWSCYLLSSKSDSWINGRSDCQNKGADLVIINSRAEQVECVCVSMFVRLNKD